MNIPGKHITSLEFIAKQVVEGFITGLHKSPFHGFSVEFSEHRLYNSGESTKSIDWKLYGKTDKLFVKRFEEETNLRCMLVIDNSSSMYFPLVSGNLFTRFFKDIPEQPKNVNKITFSVYCAAALIEIFRRQRDAVGLNIFSENIEFSCQPKSGTVHYKLLYNELEKLLQPYDNNKQKKTTTAEVLHQIAETIHKRSLVIVFSDMIGNTDNQDELFGALQHLKHKKHEVIVFDVTDTQKELHFEFENRPYHFIDMETKEEIKLHPAEVKDLYISKMTKELNALKLKCNQYKIDFIEADINKGVEQVLIPYLLKRKRMR